MAQKFLNSASEPNKPEGEITIVEKTLKQIGEIDMNKLNQERLAALNQGDQTTVERIDSIRKKIENLLESLNLVTAPETTDNPYRDQITNKSAALEKINQSISYTQLLSHLEANNVKLTITPDMQNVWRDLKVDELKWYQTRITADILKKMPTDGLELWIEIMEMCYRKLPDFGKDYTIDRSKLTFNGDLQTLVLALRNGLVKEAIVEANPLKVSEYVLDERDASYWSDQLKGNNHESYGLGISKGKMKEIIGKNPEIYFRCKIDRELPFFDTINNKINDQLNYRGKGGKEIYYGVEIDSFTHLEPLLARALSRHFYKKYGNKVYHDEWYEGGATIFSGGDELKKDKLSFII